MRKCTAVFFASTFVKKFVGLLGEANLNLSSATFFPPVKEGAFPSGVRAAGMHFPILPKEKKKEKLKCGLVGFWVCMKLENRREKRLEIKGTLQPCEPTNRARFVIPHRVLVCSCARVFECS